MRRKIEQSLEIPDGIKCEYEKGTLSCKKDDKVIIRKIDFPNIKARVEQNKILLSCEKGNKNHYRTLMTFCAHIRNMFQGLQEKFVYKLETVNVHFPITSKVEGGRLAIRNFYGEKTPRYAKILQDVEVSVQGSSVIVASHNRESAGQTAANFEKATKAKKKDRRIFQDGIYIVEKPRRKL